MKKTLSITILAVMLTLGAKGAWAQGPYPTNLTNGTYGGTVGYVTPNDGTGEFELYQAVNNLLANSSTPSSYTNNGQLDPLEYSGSTTTWQSTTSNGGYAFIGLGAGATNTLDVYSTATPNTLVNVFGGGFTGYGAAGTGSSGSPYPGVGSAITPAGQFGFVLSSNNPYTSTITNWNSNPSDNFDGMDHMVVYNLTALEGATIYVQTPGGGPETAVTLNDPYLIGFEDLPETNPVTGSPSDIDYNDYIVLVDGIAPVPEPMTVALFAFGLLAMAGFALRRKLAFVA